MSRLLLCRGFAPTYIASVSHLDQRYNSPCEVLPSLVIFIVVVLNNEKKNSFLLNHGVIGDGHNHHKKWQDLSMVNCHLQKSGQLYGKTHTCMNF